MRAQSEDATSLDASGLGFWVQGYGLRRVDEGRGSWVFGSREVSKT